MRGFFFEDGGMDMSPDSHMITLCGLLHDIGKICQRAAGEHKTHSEIGAEFIRRILYEHKETETEEGKQLLASIRYHHAKDLKHSRLEDNDLAYIVYEADNISAGADRRDTISDNEIGFDLHASKESIFNIFNTGRKSNKIYYTLDMIDTKRKYSDFFPREMQNSSVSTESQYAKILSILEKNFMKVSPLDMGINEILRIMEDTTSYIPSSTNRSEVADISLYDHSRMTAAVASAMYAYYKDGNGIINYHDICFTSKVHEERSKEMFLLLAGDFSGIQKFIYHIPNKGAMRMLRGRSFYLGISMENAVDEILDALGLSRANLIYCGGGRFYIIAANTAATKGIFDDTIEKLNKQLLNQFKTDLFIAGAYVTVSADELLGKKTVRENMFQRVSYRLSLMKQHRYDNRVLADLFDEHSDINKMEEGYRECAICHTLHKSEELSLYLASHEDDTAQVCDTCNGFYALGKMLLDRRTVFAIVSEPVPGSVFLPSATGNKFLSAASPDKALNVLGEVVPSVQEFKDDGILVRIYDRNGSRTSSDIARRIWLADYAAQKPDGMPMEFSDLSDESGDYEGGHGIKRLGVLRADVDWLGAAFMAGFVDKSQKEPYKYATLSRYASLSGELAFFFQYLINGIALKQLPAGMKPFDIFHCKGDEARKVHVVYSGGDDVFIVGAWDDLLEMAVDMRRAFSAYTNGKLSFSAGIGLFSSSYPISRMAVQTGELEDAAKESSKNKDSIALWGSNTNVDSDIEYIPAFRWNDFIEGVVGEKIHFLMEHFRFEGINDNVEGTRLMARRSLIYRIMSLLPVSGGRFNLARYAYTLARMDPGMKASNDVKRCYTEIRSQLFDWGSKLDDRRELSAALNLIIYRMREK